MHARVCVRVPVHLCACVRACTISVHTQRCDSPTMLPLRRVKMASSKLSASSAPDELLEIIAANPDTEARSLSLSNASLLGVAEPECFCEELTCLGGGTCFCVGRFPFPADTISSRFLGKATIISLTSSGIGRRIKVGKLIQIMLKAWLRRLGLRQVRLMIRAPGGREGGIREGCSARCPA